MTDTLTWDASYAIARALTSAHPGMDMEALSLETLFEWTVSLPAFQDDPEMANDGILMAIYQELFEELNPL